MALALVVAACSSDGSKLGGTVIEDGLGCTVTAVDRPTGDVPTIKAGIKVEADVTTDDLTKAEDGNCLAKQGKYLTLDMVGATAADGNTFTTTYGEERPINAQMGTGQLLAGLETGIDGLAVGQQRQILIPAALAYGADGYEAQGIGPDEDLVFVVELVAVSDSPEYCNAAADIPAGTREGKPTEVAMPVEAPQDKVVTTVLTPGDGPTAAKDSYLTVDYLGVSCGSGRQFDSSWDREDPITIALVDAEPTNTAFSVIPGWSDGLVDQKQGSLVQVDIPFGQAYGAAGRPPDIGTSDPLTFIVEIIEVSSEPPPEPAVDTATTVAN